MIKIAICDDMKNDRDRMYDLVSEYCREKNLQADIHVFDHPDKMITECERLQPHIYVLDIVMPMVTGIQAARELRWNQPDAQIIFATSESSYALESFDVNPINYILKPVKKEKLYKTLDMAMSRVAVEEEKHFTVKVKGGFVTIALDKMLYIDYRNHVVSYHLQSGEVISTPTLRIGFSEYMEQNHPEEAFARCHESIAAYVPAIDKLTKTDITLRNGELIPVSKSRYQTVAESYMDYRFKN